MRSALWTKEPLLNRDKLREFQPVFYPRSVAVVGASPNPAKFGNRYFDALVKAGFKGPLYPVNPSAAEVFGFKAYSSVKDIANGDEEMARMCDGIFRLAPAGENFEHV